MAHFTTTTSTRLRLPNVDRMLIRNINNRTPIRFEEPAHCGLEDDCSYYRRKAPFHVGVLPVRVTIKADKWIQSHSHNSQANIIRGTEWLDVGKIANPLPSHVDIWPASSAGVCRSVVLIWMIYRLLPFLLWKAATHHARRQPRQTSKIIWICFPTERAQSNQLTNELADMASRIISAADVPARPMTQLC